MASIIHYLLIEIEHRGDGGGVEGYGVEGGGDEVLQGSVEGSIAAGHGQRQLLRVPTTPKELANYEPRIVGEGHHEPNKRSLICKDDVVAYWWWIVLRYMLFR